MRASKAVPGTLGETREKYRQADFDFIAEDWTSTTFGSSSILSRGDYRSAVTRHRVTTLLQYLRNY